MRLLDAFEPIWILTAVGYLARRRGVLGEQAGLVLGRFVFQLAMPAALFLTLAGTPLSHFSGRSLLAFGASTACVIGLGWLIAARLFGRKPGEQAIWAMAAGYVNSANLGIPVAKQVLGNVSFLAEVVLLQLLVVTPLILIALDRHSDAAGKIRFGRIASLPVRNPVILGSALGVLWSATGWPVPSAVGGSLSLLSAAAVPTALISLGAGLREPAPDPAGRLARPRSVTVAEISTITMLKLVAQPAIGYLIGLALQLSRPQLLAVVVCAGLPSAQNIFIYAQEYRAGEAIASRAMLVTTTLSLATLATAAVLLS